MKLIMYGMNQDTVASDDLHKYRLDYSMRERHLTDISSFKGVSEVALISTESRNEYYLYIDEKAFKHGDLLRYLSAYTGRCLEDIILETYSKFNGDVVSHLFRLTSMISEQAIPLSVLEQSLYEGNLFETSGKTLTRLFEGALTFSLSLYDEKSLYPILIGNEAEIIQSMKNYFSLKEDLDFLIIGNHQIIKQVSMYLIGKADTYLTFLGKNEKSRKMIASVKRRLSIVNKPRKINTVQTADLNQLVYRLSKSDVIIIGPSIKNAWLSFELLEDVLEMRPSKKRQLIIDLCGSQDETLFMDYPEMNYVQIPHDADKEYASEKLKAASAYYEEYVLNKVNDFMEDFYLENEENKDKISLKKTFNNKYRYNNLKSSKV
ncbi:hypothetical protein [Alkalibacterium kapii]|uniref:Glutamyl-tRNA reductase N-terminal domain-containing protein n=1 Tax=Alkalibacterium kapii TaxID=426704 RepID=A0A511AUZ9_9LACT|nr:hypothetical protein [Alkalibacterium kapii]GEK90921.1 hypothetical protein AKA01nite_05430 [Alkalibacterium kapii]